MSTRAYRTSGVLLLLASLVAAVIIQFLGGGLQKVVAGQDTEAGAIGITGGFVVSMLLIVHWSVLIPLLMGAAAIVCLLKQGNEQRIR